MEMCPQTISDILASIARHDDSSVLLAYLEKCQKETITSWHDVGGLDVLHHAILSHNAIAIGCLFSRGLFVQPHEPVSFPYIHLACKTGQRSLIVLLLQERPFDNRPAEFTYGDQDSSTDFNDHSNQSKQKLQTPIDVAATAGHIECVKTILDLQQAKEEFSQKTLGYRGKQSKVSIRESYIDMACKCNSPKAVRLLLTENPQSADLERSVSFVVKSGKSECLDALLRYRIDRKSVFGGMNFFHVLYTYGILFDVNRYETLTLMTSVLLRHGHEPLAFRPSRTYPLYSLLSHAYANEDYLKESAPYLISCILLLLNAGADPNFDELKIEEIACDAEYETAYGRDAYSSSLHCLYNTVAEKTTCGLEESTECLDLLSEYVLKCSEILLLHGADPNYIGRLSNSKYGNSLHAFGLASQYLSKMKPTIKLLLRHGADPDSEVCDSFPLNTFCDAILESRLDPLTSRQNVIDDNATVLNLNYLMASMSQRSLSASARRLRASINSATSTGKTGLLERILSKVEASVNFVWSLKQICLMCVWTQCSRNVRSVNKLPLPMSVKTDLFDMV